MLAFLSAEAQTKRAREWVRLLIPAIVKGKECCFANIGDSRGYLISGGEITQITRDHSFVEEMVGKGKITREQARNHPQKEHNHCALGAEKTVACDTFSIELKRNDLPFMFGRLEQYAH